MWTPEEIVQVIHAITPIIATIGTIIGGFNAYQIIRTKEHVKNATAKIEVVSDKADLTTARVEEVHACLGAARAETVTGLNEVKTQAAEVAQAVRNREDSKQ